MRKIPGNTIKYATDAGLGLAIVDRIASLHQGKLDFQYRKGQSGLAVTVILPRR